MHKVLLREPLKIRDSAHVKVDQDPSRNARATIPSTTLAVSLTRMKSKKNLTL